MSEAHAHSATCCDDLPKGTLTVDQARERIQQALAPIAGVERVAIRAALGRVLAEEVRSAVDVPSHTNSAMDGYAVNSADLPAEGEAELKVIGTSWAGRPFEGTVGRGECVRIFTGAAMPEGADTALMQEAVKRDGDVIRILARHKAGENVRYAGEDLRKGDVVLGPGQMIRPADIGVLASVGVPEVNVRRRVRVAFFSTGDELRSIGETLGKGEIYDSNRYTLYGMLKRAGAELIDMGVIRDTREATRQAFKDAAAIADVVMTSGGVSVGEADFVKETLDELGKVDFWKIAMKPGKPLAFGFVDDAVFFGLPGNPVSVMVTFYQFALPALRRLMGCRETFTPTFRLPLADKLRKGKGRTEFQRGILTRDETGQPVVRTTGEQGSGILSSMSQANCFIILPRESDGAEPGDIVEVQPFDGLV
ncbi:MAG: molybdopterin molybdotransferase MoeA [Gammaproteobacteria bacterium]